MIPGFGLSDWPLAKMLTLWVKYISGDWRWSDMQTYNPKHTYLWLLFFAVNI